MTFLLLLLALTADPVTADSLRQAPGVEKVEGKGPPKPTRTLVHIADWEGISTDQPFSDHMNEVEAVQVGQTKLLQHLIEHNGLKTVHVEGFAKRDTTVLEALVKTVAGSPPLANPRNDEQRSYNEKVRTLRVKIGAEGQLAAAGKLKLIPVEDKVAFFRAMPQNYEQAVFENEARESAIVRNLLAADEPVVFVVLDAAHDLNDNVPGDCEVLKVWVKAIPK